MGAVGTPVGADERFKKRLADTYMVYYRSQPGSPQPAHHADSDPIVEKEVWILRFKR